jgi:hypothetical protein
VGPLAFYLLIAIPLNIQARERCNSDGVCYLHRAMLLVSGDVYNSITGYWSPGLTWSCVPLLILRIDPLHAIHMALFFWAGIYVATTQWLIRSFLRDRPMWVAGAGAAVALTAVRYSTPIITPDVLIAALLMLYFYLAPRRPGAAGATAALAYLAKAYAMPFFLLHFPLMVLARRAGWSALLRGLLAFGILAGPWVGILSWKYGRLTFTTATTRNRFMQDVSPLDVFQKDPDIAHVPPDPFFNIMEVTDLDPWPAWSPFDSADHFAHQVHIAAEHVEWILKEVWKFDYLGLALLGCAAVLFSGRQDAIELMLGGVIYASGFLFVAFEPRYVVPILVPISLICVLVCAQRWESSVLPACAAVCFAVAAAMSVEEELGVWYPKVPPREIARRVEQAGLAQMFASDTWGRENAACVAFFLRKKSVALMRTDRLDELENRLDQQGVKVFYYWFDPQYVDAQYWPEPQARMLIASGLWEKRLSIRLDRKRRLDIYTRVESTTRPSATRAD